MTPSSTDDPTPAANDAFAIAMDHYRSRRLPQAEAMCRQILAASPHNPDALELMGLLAHHAGQPATALELIWRALQLRPDAPNYHNDMGLVLETQLRRDQAITAFRKAIHLCPGYVEAYNNLGSCLRRNGELEAAVEAYRLALSLKPDFVEAHYNLANALKEHELLDEAIVAYQRAIALRPDFPQAHANLGIAFKDTGQLDRAIASTRRALELRPDRVTASNLLCTLQYSGECDPVRLYEQQRRWNDLYARPYARSIDVRRAERWESGADLPQGSSSSARLRIGYVSADFSSHPVGRCFLPVLANHDRSQFKIVCYSDVSRPDAMSARLRSHADVWRTTATLSDQAMAQLIDADHIDILVDLGQHTSDNRLTVFARRPAPVQVTWLGWAGTTGMDAMDYRLSDPYLDPPQRSRWLYSEKTICLPNSFWCYGPLSAQPAVNELPALRNGFITFGCFNNFCKITAGTVDLWAAVLKQVAGSRMLILAPQGEARRRLLEMFQTGGVNADRIEFVDRRPHPQYLELYRQVDICLDTVPYGGHTTSIDSFWMGAPVVSLSGELPVWRGGLSIASNLGLSNLAADTPERYAAIAPELAFDLPRLAELRRTLRARIEASPIMNARQFARDLETIFRRIWQTWRQSRKASGS